MNIDVCIDYKPAGYSDGSASAIAAECTVVSNFKICRREDRTVVIEFTDDSTDEFVLSEFNKRALSPIVAEYLRLKQLSDRTHSH